MSERKVPGWHGKLPSLGDFASRRLDPAFVATWDDWLAAGMLALREQDPGGWLEAYLASPSWRFLLMPQVMPGEAGGRAWAGVLMPSVDRVGRYFPFTAALALGTGPVGTQQMSTLWHWLDRLDELSAEALQDDWSVDRLEDELARMATPDLSDQPDGPLPQLPGERGTLIEFNAGSALDADRLIGREAMALWQARAEGRAYWYANTAVAGRRLAVSRGLPAASALGRLFGASSGAAGSVAA